MKGKGRNLITDRLPGNMSFTLNWVFIVHALVLHVFLPYPGSPLQHNSFLACKCCCANTVTLSDSCCCSVQTAGESQVWHMAIRGCLSSSFGTAAASFHLPLHVFAHHWSSHMASSSRLTYNKASSNIFSVSVFPDIVQALPPKGHQKVSDNGDTPWEFSLTEDQFNRTVMWNSRELYHKKRILYKHFQWHFCFTCFTAKRSYVFKLLVRPSIHPSIHP